MGQYRLYFKWNINCLRIISLTYYKTNSCCPQTYLASNLRFTCLIMINCTIVINVKMPHFFYPIWFLWSILHKIPLVAPSCTLATYTPLWSIYYLAIYSRVHQTRLMHSIDHLLTESFVCTIWEWEFLPSSSPIYINLSKR